MNYVAINNNKFNKNLHVKSYFKYQNLTKFKLIFMWCKFKEKYKFCLKIGYGLWKNLV